MKTWKSASKNMPTKFYQVIKQQIFWLSKRLRRVSYLELLFVFCIVAVTVWGYYDTLDDFFIMDDFHMIRGHSNFKQFLKHWVSPVGGNSYRPLIDLLFVWDFYWWGWNPLGWHVSDLIFHIINVFLVYELAKYLTKSFYAGMVTGVLFGLHPGNSEAVIWISARMDVVCTTFFLLSIRYVISSKVEPLIPRLPGEVGRYIFSATQAPPSSPILNPLKERNFFY